MKKIIACFAFFIACQCVTGQDRTLEKKDSILSVLKSNIYRTIVNDLAAPVKNDSLRVYILINTSTANVNFSLGPAAGRPSFSNAADIDNSAIDLLDKELKRGFGKTRFRLGDQPSFNRELIIETSDFFNPPGSPLKNQGRLYIEIGRPLFGWESVYIFYNTQIFPDNRKEYHRKYYSDSLFIPVYFFYREKNGSEKHKSHLYTFRFTVKPTRIEAILLTKSTF
jgi:hypothetical protein